MKKIYIDCGCFTGDTIDVAERFGIKEIYAFDAVPFEEWKDYPDVKFEAKAVWIYDGEIDFSKIDGVGSSLIDKKRGYDDEKVIKVKCFDFSKWLEQFRGDKVIVKMDIEGAEYEVLKKVIEDKNDDIIDFLIIEFHAHKIPSMDYRDTEELINEKFRDKMSNTTFASEEYLKYIEKQND